MITIARIGGCAAIAFSLVIQPQLGPAEAGGCENIRFEVVAQLGPVEVAPGVFVLAALPTPTIIAGVEGLLSSIITSARPSGSKGQGAQHFTLVHTFVSTDPDQPGGFTTSDQAVGVPAGKDPNTGIINDVMTIVEGTGVFENASGFMVNHAELDLGELTLSTSVHGRVCADGL